MTYFALQKRWASAGSSATMSRGVVMTSRDVVMTSRGVSVVGAGVAIVMFLLSGIFESISVEF